MLDEQTKKIEAKWQKHWEDNKTWEVNSNSKKEKYFGTVAYPYANSVLHIGHGRTYTVADVFLRYQRLLGKNVLYPLGYHISGTPVLAVADGIKRKDEKVIKQVRDAISDYIENKKEQDKLIETFTEPEKIAEFFSTKIEGALNSIGISISYDRQFTTGEPIYNKFIEWQYQKLKDSGVLKQGKYPILYSAQDENAVGEDDIKDGDIEKVALSEMTYILFKLKDTKEFIAVATLRPDAIFGTTNLWVNPKEDMIKIKVDGQIWITTKEAQVKLEHQFDNVKLISEHKGEEFVGLNAITPLIDREVIIAEASFLDAKHGTGLAYSSPAGSPHDFLGLQKAKEEGRLPKDLEVVNTVTTKDKKGNIISYDASCPAEAKLQKFGIKNTEDKKLEDAKQELYKEEHFGGILNDECGEFSGAYIKTAKDKVKEKLIELNLGGTLYETSRRATTRGGADVIVAKLDGQWFLDYSDEKVKEKAHAVLENMVYLPNNLKDAQSGYINWANMRPCARKRGLGTKLPYDKDWVIEPLSDSTIYQMFYLISGIIKKHKINAENLSIELFDYVFFGEGDSNKIKNISKEVLEEMRNEVKYWNNMDFRYTAHSHMSNHLNFLIYHYGLIFPKSMWPGELVVGQFMMRNGEKISKSKGNGTPLYRMKNIYGADLYRLYTIVSASFEAEMDFKDEEVLQLEKKFNKFKELMFAAKSRKVQKYDSFNKIDKWLISKFYSKAKEYFLAMKDMKLREAYIGIIYEFLSDISYHTRRTSEENTLNVLRFLFVDYLKIMTPVIPHICEELYEGASQEQSDSEGLGISDSLKGKQEISLESFDTNCDDYINKEAEDLEGIVEYTLALISRTKDQKQLNTIKKITIVQASKERFELFDEIKIQLEKTKNIKEIFGTLNSKFSDENKFISKFVPKTLGTGLSFYLPIEEEKKLLEDVKKFLEKEFESEISFSNVENEDIQTGQIMPSKPGVVLE